jgi:tRNA(fMet)-specific endonuclease VapC
MSCLIDTDVLSYYLKNNALVIRNFSNFVSARRKLPCISIITYYEILSGLQAINAKRQIDLFKKIFPSKNILLIRTATAQIAADIFGKLRLKGIVVDDIDILIAASAIEHKLIVVTNNEKHFGKITGIKIENWSKKEFNK